MWLRICADLACLLEGEGSLLLTFAPPDMHVGCMRPAAHASHSSFSPFISSPMIYQSLGHTCSQSVNSWIATCTWDATSNTWAVSDPDGAACLGLQGCHLTPHNPVQLLPAPPAARPFLLNTLEELQQQLDHVPPYHQYRQQQQQQHNNELPHHPFMNQAQQQLGSSSSSGSSSNSSNTQHGSTGVPALFVDLTASLLPPQDVALMGWQPSSDAHVRAAQEVPGVLRLLARLDGRFLATTVLFVDYGEGDGLRVVKVGAAMCASMWMGQELVCACAYGYHRVCLWLGSLCMCVCAWDGSRGRWRPPFLCSPVNPKSSCTRISLLMLAPYAHHLSTCFDTILFSLPCMPC